jgi:hypothetical protein
VAPGGPSNGHPAAGSQVAPGQPNGQASKDQLDGKSDHSGSNPGSRPDEKKKEYTVGMDLDEIYEWRLNTSKQSATSVNLNDFVVNSSQTRKRHFRDFLEIMRHRVLGLKQDRVAPLVKEAKQDIAPPVAPPVEEAKRAVAALLTAVEEDKKECPKDESQEEMENIQTKAFEDFMFVPIMPDVGQSRYYGTVRLVFCSRTQLQRLEYKPGTTLTFQLPCATVVNPYMQPFGTLKSIPVEHQARIGEFRDAGKSQQDLNLAFQQNVLKVHNDMQQAIQEHRPQADLDKIAKEKWVDIEDGPDSKAATARRPASDYVKNEYESSKIKLTQSLRIGQYRLANGTPLDHVGMQAELTEYGDFAQRVGDLHIQSVATWSLIWKINMSKFIDKIRNSKPGERNALYNRYGTEFVLGDLWYEANLPGLARPLNLPTKANAKGKYKTVMGPKKMAPREDRKKGGNNLVAFDRTADKLPTNVQWLSVQAGALNPENYGYVGPFEATLKAGAYVDKIFVDPKKLGEDRARFMAWHEELVEQLRTDEKARVESPINEMEINGRVVLSMGASNKLFKSEKFYPARDPMHPFVQRHAELRFQHEQNSLRFMMYPSYPMMPRSKQDQRLENDWFQSDFVVAGDLVPLVCSFASSVSVTREEHKIVRCRHKYAGHGFQQGLVAMNRSGDKPKAIAYDISAVMIKYKNIDLLQPAGSTLRIGMTKDIIGVDMDEPLALPAPEPTEQPLKREDDPHPKKFQRLK